MVGNWCWFGSNFLVQHSDVMMCPYKFDSVMFHVADGEFVSFVFDSVVAHTYSPLGVKYNIVQTRL